MVDVIKRVASKNTFQLAILGNVTTDKLRIMVVVKVAHPDFVAAAAQFIDQEASYGPQTSGNKNLHINLLNSRNAGTGWKSCIVNPSGM